MAEVASRDCGGDLQPSQHKIDELMSLLEIKVHNRSMSTRHSRSFTFVPIVQALSWDELRVFLAACAGARFFRMSHPSCTDLEVCAECPLPCSTFPGPNQPTASLIN